MWFRFEPSDSPTCYDNVAQAQLKLKQVDGVFVLPAHEFRVSIESVGTAEVPEATDASASGYFHRIRLRSQSVDLFEDAQPGQEEPGEKPLNSESEGHSLKFVYRPPPRLDIDFLKASAEGDATHSLATTNRFACTDFSLVGKTGASSEYLGWQQHTGYFVVVEILQNNHIARSF